MSDRPFDAWCVHPAVGSVWLTNCRIVDGYVIGTAEADTMWGHTIYETMNFPVSCIRKRSDA